MQTKSALIVLRAVFVGGVIILVCVVATGGGVYTPVGRLEIVSKGATVSEHVDTRGVDVREVPKPTRKATIDDLRQRVGQPMWNLITNFAWSDGVDSAIVQSSFSQTPIIVTVENQSVELTFKDGMLASCRVVQPD